MPPLTTTRAPSRGTRLADTGAAMIISGMIGSIRRPDSNGP